MKLTILAALISASLAWSGAPARQDCVTRTCPPAPAPVIASQVAVAHSDELVMPRSPGITLRDCVGFPRWIAVVMGTMVRTWTPGSEACTPGSCPPAPAPMVVAGSLV